MALRVFVVDLFDWLADGSMPDLGNFAAFSWPALFPPPWPAVDWPIDGGPSCAAEVVFELIDLPGDDSGVDVRPPEASSGLLDIHLEMESLTALIWKDILIELRWGSVEL